MTSPDRINSLQEELRELSKKQSASLQLAVYMKMDAATGAEYDVRAKRIAEIIKLLNPATETCQRQAWTDESAPEQ